MQNFVGVAIESLVAVLLAATIVYCALLDRRLRRLRADEATMRETVVELVNATSAAERAIAALHATVGSCEETLAERLGRAQALSEQIVGQLGAGEEVIGQITKIARAARDHFGKTPEREADWVEAARREAEALEAERAAPPLSAAAATAAAAELFASRIRAFSLGVAS